MLTTGDLGRLFETAGHIADPPRRALALAILAVLSQAALRVHEAVALDVSQVDLEGASLLAVRGKGGSVHDLPLNPPTVELLRAWLARRRFLARDGEPALLISVRGTRLSIRSVQHLLTRLGLAMDLQKRLSPHVLRHTAATLALSLGTDVSTVGDLLRHADLNVTRRYLHLVDTRKREAVSRMGSTIPVSVLTHPALISGGVSAARPGEPAQLPSDSGTFPLDVQLPLDAAA
ncbi:MAG: tyrosine-type recombinase/integrase [Deltaproteobacteria bacterium]|nr:tyrosine-type recombinase/integrase [Deltaproteobacteria bacterium]